MASASERAARCRAASPRGLRLKCALFADAEAPEDDAQQVVRGELAGDRGQRRLRLAQLLGEELERRRRRARDAPRRRRGAPRLRAAPARGVRGRGTCPRSSCAPRRCASTSRSSSSMPAPVIAPTATRAARAPPVVVARPRRRRDARQVRLVVHDHARRAPAAGARGSRGRRRRAHRSPARASTSSSARSARSTAAHVRSMPIASTGSSVSRRPAVSTTVSGMPRDLDAPLDRIARGARRPA